MKMLNWNELAELGLLERINREIFHPLGIAVYRVDETGLSGGALVSDDGEFKFPDDMISKVKSNAEVVGIVHGENNE